MATHLLVDIINGVKLVILSAKQRHDWPTRTRYFIGGTLMVNITAFTLYVSTIYNAAIATSKCCIIDYLFTSLYALRISSLAHSLCCLFP